MVEKIGANAYCPSFDKTTNMCNHPSLEAPKGNFKDTGVLIQTLKECPNK